LSRFNNPKALLSLPREPLQTPLKPQIAPKDTPLPLPGDESALPDSSLGQRAGFALLCVFPIFAYANEFALRLFHVKAYLSTVSWALLPLLLLLSGNLLRGMRDAIGRLWLLFLAWLCIAAPFSVWRGGSLLLLADYIPHGWIQLYYFAAFVISIRHLRRLMFFLIASNLVLLVDCFWFGSVQGGRLEIPGSIFFANANDLSLQLIIAITQFTYLVFQPQYWKRILGAAAILAALVFMFRTAGRGAFVAILILAVVSLLLARNRVRYLLIGIPVLAAALLLTPAAALHRMMLIAIGPAAESADLQDESAAASQLQRTQLFHQSLNYAIEHPLLGVGPGQFAVAVYGDAVKQGQPAPWLGTHNSYTQVASECGIPALLFYVSVIVLALVSNCRTYRRGADVAALRDLRALAFCLFSGVLVYAVCTFFFHIAYSNYLPALAGMSVALRLAPRPPETCA
jgi:O-antigen ligase